MKIILNICLAILISYLAYALYASFSDKIKLKAVITQRNEVVIGKLEKIRNVQVEYKKKYAEYASSFEKLINFLKYDSIVVIKMEGNVPDSLLGKEALALKMGIIKRDTSLAPVNESLFEGNSVSIVDDLKYIPFSGGKEFSINSGETEKGKIKVKVFEVKASYMDVYKGLDVSTEGIDLTKYFAIGSMTEANIDGNWSN